MGVRLELRDLAGPRMIHLAYIACCVAAVFPVDLGADSRCDGTHLTKIQAMRDSAQTGNAMQSGIETLVQAAVSDLADRLSVDPSAIEVVSVEEVTWPNPSLGCPVPGMRYRQIPVDGYRILLRADGKTFAYHGGGSRGPFLCEHPSPKS